jgi:low affinity Fe/Cu permease
VEVAATRLIPSPLQVACMGVSAVLALGPLGSPPGILVTLVLLAVIILVGRFFLALAWRLVLIALAAIAVLWVLGVLGFSLGVL